MWLCKTGIATFTVRHWAQSDSTSKELEKSIHFLLWLLKQRSEQKSNKTEQMQKVYKTLKWDIQKHKVLFGLKKENKNVRDS